MEVKVNRKLDSPVVVVHNGVSMCFSLDEAEDLIGSLKDAIEECVLEGENEVLYNMAMYLHKKGIKMRDVLEMAETLKKIVFKYSPKISLDEYYRNRRAQEEKEDRV